MQREQHACIDVALGKKHILELVNVNVLDQFHGEVDARLAEVAEDVTNTILARCLLDAAVSCSDVMDEEEEDDL